MPPIKKYTKEDIIDEVCKIIEKEGTNSINARKIASNLGGSVQLIYHNFSTMEELYNEAYSKIHSKFKDILENATDKERPYLAKGMAYVKFARDYPEYYKIIFMNNTSMNIDEFIAADYSLTNNVMSSINKRFNVQEKDIVDFHKKVWIFSHGLACLLATKTVIFTDKEIEDLLVSTVGELFVGYKEKSENEKNNRS